LLSNSSIRRTLFAWLAAAALGAAVCTPVRAAAEGARPAITGAKVFVSGDTVVATVTATGLFSEEIVGTIQSGLPAVVELLCGLVDRGDDTIEAGLHTIELRYDVWDNVYWIERADSKERFASFAAMARAAQTLRRVTIVPLSALHSNTEYAIRMSVAVHPLASREKKELAGWVGENVRSGSDGSLREQVLNLNDLIEHFFSRDESPANRSDWYRTEFFRPSLLPAAGEEDK
jgi:hypothetical protein